MGQKMDSIRSAEQTIGRIQQPIPSLHNCAGISRSGGSLRWDNTLIRDFLINSVTNSRIGTLIDTEGTRRALVAASTLPSCEITDLVDTFSSLHHLITERPPFYKPYNKTQIIEHVQKAITALEAVIGKNPPSNLKAREVILGKIQAAFELPIREEETIQDITATYKEMLLLKSALYEYFCFLDGKAPCTKDQLKKMREGLSFRLLHTPVNDSGGFLQHILQVQYRQQGNLGFDIVARNLMEAVKRAITKVFAPLAKMNPNIAPPFVEFEDPDIPGSEIVIHSDGHREIITHTNSKESPISVMRLLSGTYEYLKNGSSPVFITWYIETLKLALTQIQSHVQNQKIQALHLRIIDEEFLAGNERTSCSLERALQILASLQKTGVSKEEVEVGIHEIAEILKNHPIGIKYLFHMNLLSYLPLSQGSAPSITPKDPITVLQDMIYSLEGQGQTHQIKESVDENTAFSWQIENVKRTSIQFTIYQAILWWASWCPWWISWISSPLPKTLSIPTFDSMMIKLYKPDGTALVTPDQANAIFRASMQEMIWKCTHLFFITKWVTELVLPIIEWICNRGISRVFKEVDNRITSYINTSYNEATGDTGTSIPDTLTSVANGIVNAYKLYNEGHNSSCLDKNEIISRHFFNDPRKLFLRGHSGKDSVYQNLEIALLNLLRDFSWTDWLSGWSASLTEWAHDKSESIIQAICWMIVAPVRAFLWSINTAIVWPTQVIFNYIMKWSASKLISVVELPKKLTEKAINSIIGHTDFTPVLDDILLDLLKMLWSLMQEPIDPNSRFGEIKTSQKNVDSISNMLSSLLRVLCVSKNQNTVFTSILRGLSSTLEGSALNGVALLLSKSIVILSRQQKKISILALSTLHKAMITRDAPPRFIAGENITVLNRSRALIDHYISLLGWEGVKLATNKLSDPLGDEEYRINAHARAIQKQFGFQSQLPNPSEKLPIKKESLILADPSLKTLGFEYQSKLAEWFNTIHVLLEGDLTNPIVVNAIGNLDKIHKELLQTSYSLRSELILMASDGSITKAALDVHKERVLAISEALSEFQKGFQVIHEFYLNKAHPALSNIHLILANISSRANSIKNLIVFMQIKQNSLENGELELQNLRAELNELKKIHIELIGNLPPQGPISEIAHLLDMSLRTLETNLCIASEKQKNYINFTKKFIQPIQTASGALSDFTSRALEFSINQDSRGLSVFLQTHLTEIQTFLPQWNLTGTNDHANFSILQRVLDLSRDLPLLTDLTTRKHIVIQRCNEFKGTLLRIGTLLQNEMNGECTRTERNFSNLLSRSKTQCEKTAESVQQAQCPSVSAAVREALGSLPSEPNCADRNGMFTSILKLEKAVTSLTSVDKTSFDLFQKIPIAPLIQKEIFDFIQSTIYNLLKTVIQDKSVLEGFLMRLYVRFLESQKIDLSDQAQTTDHIRT
jgi:hypothetical protein